ncbi:MAG: AEC family transporter [Spirochaetes bacterium]|nr:AEC family transporter [Spirochaetota bacterium]
METPLFVLQAIAPFGVLLALGFFLAARGITDEGFARVANALVFNVALPALIITEFLKTPFTKAVDLPLVGVGVGVTLAITALGLAVSMITTRNRESRGPLVQGMFRANLVVVGLPLIQRAFPEGSLGIAVALTAFLMPLYNLLAVIVLTLPGAGVSRQAVRQALVALATNPLILATIAGVLLSLYAPGRTPLFILKTGETLASLAFPLAMIAMGVDLLRLRERSDWGNTILATGVKLLVVPAAAAAACWGFGIRDLRLGVLVVLVASPTAVASYAMARGMGQDGRLAASIVALSTLASVATLAVWMTWLHLRGLA